MKHKPTLASIYKDVCEEFSTGPAIIRMLMVNVIFVFIVVIGFIVFLLKESPYILLAGVILIASGLVSPCVIDVLGLHSECQVKTEYDQ